jgi:hypothetical protein
MPTQVRGEALVGARIIDPHDFGTPGAGPFPGEVEYFMSGQERPYSVKFDPPDNGTLSYSLQELSEVLEHEDSRATAAALALAWAQDDRRATLTGAEAMAIDDDDDDDEDAPPAAAAASPTLTTKEYTPTIQLCPPLEPGTKYYDPEDSAFELLDVPEITEIVPRKWRRDNADDAIDKCDKVNEARRRAHNAPQLDADGLPAAMSSRTAIVPPAGNLTSAAAGRDGQELSELELSAHPNDEAHFKKMVGVMARASKMLRLMLINGDHRLWTMKSQVQLQAYLKERFPGVYHLSVMNTQTES